MLQKVNVSELIKFALVQFFFALLCKDKYFFVIMNVKRIEKTDKV